VFVLDDHRGVTTFDTTRPRIVVREGRVVSASSLENGGSASPATNPTMDALFDRAEQVAAFGERGVPARFAAEYDEALGYLRTLDADGRYGVADDETFFQINCFATDLERGCRPIWLTKAECLGAGGTIVKSGTGEGCASHGWSIGLLSDREQCCRNYSAGSFDEIAAAQCRAARGHEDECARDELVVGSSQSRLKSCCRRFVR
jgi:hypothetical protein